MKLGYAQIEITPALDRPVYLAGFGQNRCAESIHDPLYARMLAISDGATTLVLCALDLIGVFQSDALDHEIQEQQVDNMLRNGTKCTIGYNVIIFFFLK